MRTRHRALFALVAPTFLTLGLTGCQGNLAGLGGLLQGALGGGLGGGLAGLTGSGSGTGGFQPGPYSPFGSSGGGLPGLNAPGTPSNSPSSLLPAPQASAGSAQRILAAYQVPVQGAGATPEIMNVIADGLRHYKPENLRGLARINVLSSGGGSTAGMWYMDGGPAQIDLYAHAGWGEPVSLHTVTHELGHHWSLMANEADGNAFDQALGNGPNGHVSEYSYNTTEDKLAEAVAFMLIGYDKAEQRPLPQWNPSQEAFAVVQRSIVTGRPTF